MLTQAQERQRAAVEAAVRKLDGSSQDIEAYGPAVLVIFAGVHVAVFEALDNAIGNARAAVDGKGWMVRRVRNHPAYGRRLFAGLVRS